MRHCALARHEPLCFIQTEANVEAELVVDKTSIHDAGSGIAELADIGAEEDGEAGFEHGDAGGFDGLGL